MSDDQFTKLFTYMQAEFAKLHEELAKKADRDHVDRLYNLLTKTSSTAKPMSKNARS